jgi:hypothetical protein
MGKSVSREILRLRLHRIFNIKENNYATSVKLLYIYDWLEPKAGDCTLDLITEFRKAFPHESNLRNLDAFYNEVKLLNMTSSKRYNTTALKVPIHRDDYVSGWRL